MINTKLMIPSLMMALFFAMIFQSSHAQTKKKIVKTSSTASVKKPVTVKVTESQILEGKSLLSKSDCLGCHKLDVKLVGPAYKDVAKKYPANEVNYNILTKKVIGGGKDVWGPIPMPPHPVLSFADANKMVKYILSLK